MAGQVIGTGNCFVAKGGDWYGIWLGEGGTTPPTPTVDNLWGDVKAKTWGEIKTRTWGDVKTNGATP